MRVVIADDEPLGRYTLRSMIVELQVPEEAILEVGDGVELFDAVERTNPDVAFVDIKMPKLNGLEAIGRLVNDCPQTIWIVVSAHDDFSFAQEAIRLGVFRYILKPADPSELADALEAVAVELNLRSQRRPADRPTVRAITDRVLPTDRSELSGTVRRLILWTEQHFRESVGLAQAASAMDYSVGYLSSRFRKETGVTYSDYLTALRMETARDLLQGQTQGQRSLIGEVATAVGYTSRRQFTRNFHGYWKETPVEARQAFDVEAEPKR